MALHMLTFGQTFALMSNLAIPNLPPQFRQVSRSLGISHLPWLSSTSMVSRAGLEQQRSWCSAGGHHEHPDAVLQVSESFSWTLLNIKAPWDQDHPTTYASQSAGPAFPYPPQGITTASFNNRGAQSSNGYFSLPSSGAVKAQADARIHPYCRAPMRHVTRIWGHSWTRCDSHC